MTGNLSSRRASSCRATLAAALVASSACGPPAGRPASESAQAARENAPAAIERAVEVAPEPEELTRVASAALASCPATPLELPNDLPLDSAPPHTRQMWLEEALALADVVVRARLEADHWEVEERICGEIPEGPLAARLLGSAPSSSAIRLLVRTPRGYLDVSPEGGLTIRSGPS